MWATVEEANTYFADTLESAKWGTVNKLGALNSAYRVLVSHPAYAFPSNVSQKMKDANCEYALYLATIGTQRQTLIDQGVKSFSVGDFSESYKDTDQGYGTNVTLPSIVKQLLDEYEKGVPFVGYFDR